MRINVLVFVLGISRFTYHSLLVSTGRIQPSMEWNHAPYEITGKSYQNISFNVGKREKIISTSKSREFIVSTLRMLLNVSNLLRNTCFLESNFVVAKLLQPCFLYRDLSAILILDIVPENGTCNTHFSIFCCSLTLRMPIHPRHTS